MVRVFSILSEMTTPTLVFWRRSFSAGAVGSMVGQIARLKGASRVVGSAGTAEKVALLTDRYGAYDTVVDPRLYPGRISAACAAHARRNFEELTKDGTSPIGLDALRRFARIYEVEGELMELSDEQRLTQRQRLANAARGTGDQSYFHSSSSMSGTAGCSEK